MKIKHLVFFVNPMSYGTIAKYDKSLIDNIPNANIYYFGHKKNPYYSELNNFFPIYNYGEGAQWKKGISYTFSHITLLINIILKRPKIVHFQWFKVYRLDYLLIKIIKIFKCKVVFTAHNTLPHDSGAKYFEWFKKIYSVVDLIIVHSDNTKEELKLDFSVHEDKMATVNHGLFDYNDSYNADRMDSIKQKFIDSLALKDKTVFSLVGLVSAYKGIDLVIDAWKSFFAADDSIHLFVAGKGEENRLNEIEGLSNTTILNYSLSDEEFFAILNLSDYLLLPYRKISQSGVLLTALNLEKRVIVSDEGGLTDPFKYGNIGYIMEETNHIGLRDSILLALDNKSNYPSEHTWKSIKQAYSWEKIGGQTYDIYRRLMTNYS